MLWHLAGSQPGRLGAQALLLLLKPCCVCAGLAVPVHAYEAVVEHCLDARYGPSGFFVRRVLDQRRLRVSAKHHLDGGRKVEEFQVFFLQSWTYIT